MNFTARYLGILGNNIADENGNFIPTIKIIKDKDFFFQYKKPSFTYDAFLKEKKLYSPNTVKINYSDLNRFGLSVISTKSRIRGRYVIYKLCRKIKIPKEANVLNLIPREHFIEYDMANKIIRITGPNSLGEWTVI